MLRLTVTAFKSFLQTNWIHSENIFELTEKSDHVICRRFICFHLLYKTIFSFPGRQGAWYCPRDRSRAPFCQRCCLLLDPDYRHLSADQIQQRQQTDVHRSFGHFKCCYTLYLVIPCLWRLGLP